MNDRRADTGRFWKRVIAGLFVLFFAAMAASFGIAALKVSRVVDKDYYSHGLHYGDAQNRTGEPAGWSMTAALAGDRIQLRVCDAAGAPLGGGTVVFDVETGGKGTRPPLILVEAPPGTYMTDHLPATWSELRGTIHVTRGGTAIHKKMVFFN